MVAVTFCAVFAACSRPAPRTGPDGRFQPTWESIRTHDVPEWFHNAKLGIFIHWGLYSVPAWATPVGELGKVDWNKWFANNPYAEWYLNTLRIDGSPTQEFHRKTTDRISIMMISFRASTQRMRAGIRMPGLRSLHGSERAMLS